MTLEALQYLVTDLALKRNLVNCAMSGPSIYAINPEDIKEYPLVFVSPTGTHTIKENTTRYSLTFFYMDRLLEDSSNEESINSAGIETLRNLKLQLSKLEVVTDIEEDVDIRLFTETERMADRVAGAYMTIWIETLNPSTCPAFFDEYGYYMGNYFATEGLEAVLDDLASKEWVERLIASISISGITPEEFERIMGDYVLERKFAKINGSGITNNQRFSLVEQSDYNEFLSAYTAEIQNIWNSITSGATPADYDAVKGQVSANTRDIAALSAQTSANTAQISALEQSVSGLTPQGYEELKQQVSANTENIAALSAATQSAITGINETLETINNTVTGINETVIAISAQTSGISQDLADLSGSTEQAVSSLTHDIETLSAAISAATPADYDAVKAQVSANTQNITVLSGTTSGIASDLAALSAYTETLTGNTYTLPTASASVKGGIQVGTGLSMSGDTMNADIASTDVHVVMKLTKAQYDLIPTKDPETLYIIIPS